MVKHTDGTGVTIQIPEDLTDIKSCIDYINSNKIINIDIIAAKELNQYNLDFLYDINSIDLIAKLHIEGNFVNYNAIYRFTELKYLSIYPTDKYTIIDLAIFHTLRGFSTERLTSFINLDIPPIEWVFLCGVTIDFKSLQQIKGIKILTLHGVKEFSFSKIRNLQKLQHIQFTQCNVKNFDGVNSLQNLSSIWVFHCSSLTSIEGLSKLPNLQKVWITSCPKLTDISELGQAKKLIMLILENIKKCNLEFISDMQSLSIECINLMNCGSIPTLQFIEKYPNLKTFGFWDTNILDGNLTPCLQLKFAHTANKRHYNLKAKQLPRDDNYLLSNWIE